MEDRWFIGSLESNPEVASALGQYVSEFAAVEYWMLKMLALTLRKDDIGLAQALFGHVRSINDRCKILKSSANAAVISDDTRNAIISFYDRIMQLNSRRNDLIHGVWETNRATGEVRMAPAALSASRKTGKVAEPITANDIYKSVMEIRRFTVELVQALFRSTLP